MRDLFRKNKEFVILAGVTAIVSTLTSLIAPILLQEANQAESVSFDVIYYILLGMFISLLIQISISVYKENYAARFNTDYLFSLVDQMMHMSYDSYVKLESTYLINRIFSAVDALYIFLISNFSTTISAVFTLILSLVLVGQVSTTLIIPMLVLIPMNLLGFRYINKVLKRRMEAMQKNSASANKNLVATLSNNEAIKAGMNNQVIEYLLQDEISLMYQSLASTNKFAISSSAILNFINQGFQIFVYLWSSLLITQGELALSNLIIVSIILPLFFSALGNLTKVNIDWNSLNTANEFIEKDLKQNQEVDGALAIESITSISMKNPTFTRENVPYQFAITEEIHTGDVVYLSGKSGSGKSSLLKLLLKFYPANGIYLNDKAINDFQNESVRGKIAYLSQDTTILTTSIEKNIGNGKELTLAQKEKIENSHILDPILANKTWHTLITENGSNLSGGERQRIAVARLLMTEADVYLLDESTSSIDEESAEIIFNTVLKLAEGKIVIFTSHNQSHRVFASKTISI